MIPNAGYNPYYLSDFNNYNAQAYDNSGYGNYNNFNTISPFSAWVQNNITGLGAPPPGMTAGAYGERMQTLSDRFSKYGAYSAAFTGASYLGSMAFMFPDVTHAALTGVSAAIGGAPLGHGGLLNRALGGVLSANPIGILNSAFNLPIDAASQAFLQPNATKLGAGLMRGLDTFGGMGSSLSANLDSIIGGINEKGWLGGIKTGINAAGSKSAFLARAFELPFKVATGFAAYAAVAGVTDTFLQGALNAAVGVDIEQDKISDTFESLSSRVLYGGSGHNAKSFAKEMAKEIRQRSFADATPTGLMGYLGISDTVVGRFTGGWSAISEMQTKTAQYGLMAESGLLSKSGSADEFIKKADAMYAAIAKLGDALGQTTTKAMETARVLKSQGISDPLGIANAGSAIATSAAMSGYSHNQVMAIASEATEAFRGSLFSSDAAYGLANSVIRKTALAPNLIGSQAYDKLLYENRGQDSMNVNLTRTMAGVSNSHEMRQMLIASMYKRTKTGFEFTGSVNASEINNAVSGNSFLNDENTLALLNSNFQGLTQSEMRAAERSLSKFSSNLTGADMQNAFGAFAKRRGYSNQQDMFETIFRQQGMSPDAAFNMAKIITADTRAQEFTYDYFNRRETQLSKYVSDRIDAESETGLSKLTFGYHKLLGRSTAFAETALLTGLGGLIGGPIGAVIGAGIGIASGSTYYQGVGERMGYSGNGALFAGAAGEMAANIGMYGVVKAAYNMGSAAYTGTAMTSFGQHGAMATTKTFGGTVMSGVAPIITGLGAGYAGDYLTARYFSDYSSNQQLGIGAGLGGGVGLGAGFAGSLLLPSLFTPWGIVAATVVGAGYGLYRGYNRLFGGDGDVVGEREQLRNQMQLSQGLHNLRGANPNAYNRLLSMADESKLNLQFTNYNAATDTMTGDVKSGLLGSAGAITRGYHTANSNMKKITQDELVKYLPGYEAWVNNAVADAGSQIGYGTDGQAVPPEAAHYAGPLISKEDFSIEAYIATMGKEIDLEGGDAKEMARLRYMISLMGGKAGADLQKRVIDALGKRTFKGKQGTVYDAKGFFTGHEGSYFQRTQDFIKDRLLDVNKTIQEMTGANAEYSPVNAANASAIFNILDAKKRGDGEAYNKALAFAQGTMGAGDITTLHAMLSDPNRTLSDDAIDKVQRDMAMIIVASDSAAYQDAIERFGRNKGAMLGTENLSVVQNRMRNLLLGKGGDKSEAYLKLKANNFSAVTDEATKVFLQQSEGAMNVLDNIAGKTWAEYKESVQKSDIDSTTKQMLLNQLSGRDEGQFILSDDVTGIRKTVGQQLLASHANYMAQSTGQSLAERQATSLDSIDRGIRELIRLTASDKENDYVKGKKGDKNEFYTAPEDPNSVETTSNIGAFFNAVGKLGRREFSLF